MKRSMIAVVGVVAVVAVMLAAGTAQAAITMNGATFSDHSEYYVDSVVVAGYIATAEAVKAGTFTGSKTEFTPEEFLWQEPGTASTDHGIYTMATLTGLTSGNIVKSVRHIEFKESGVADWTDYGTQTIYYPVDAYTPLAPYGACIKSCQIYGDASSWVIAVIVGGDPYYDGPLIGANLHVSYGFTVYESGTLTGSTVHERGYTYGTGISAPGTVAFTGIYDPGTLSITPEPATMALLAAGGIGMLLRRKRSK